MDQVLRNALIAGALLAGGGVFYHYGIFLPRVEEQKRSDIREKEANRKQVYSDCMEQARSQYDSSWAAACQSVAESSAMELKNCLKDKLVMSNQFMGAEYCQKTYGSADASPDCILPGKRADTITGYFKHSQDRCATEARLGVQE